MTHGSRRTFGVAIAALAVVTICVVSPAQEAKPAGYPRISLATGYEHDPAWPERTPSAPWADMPGIAVDKEDQVWLFTRANPPVQVYDKAGKFLRGFGQDLVGRAHHLKIDHEGMVWLADNGNHVVMRLTPEGKLLRRLGTSGAPGEDETHFNRPTDMAIAPSGDVFVSDGYGNNRIVHFDKEGRFVKAWGKLGVGPGEFSLPHAIAIDSKGRLYVADRNNARIQVFDPKGAFLAEWRDLIVPWGLWVTPADEIWACGSSAMRWRPADSNCGVPPKDQLFMKFNADGKLLQLFTVPKGEDGKERPGELNWVHCLALDSKGNIYAGDIQGRRAQRFVKQK